MYSCSLFGVEFVLCSLPLFSILVGVHLLLIPLPLRSVRSVVRWFLRCRFFWILLRYFPYTFLPASFVH